MSSPALRRFNAALVTCRLCPRLVAHRERVADVKRRQFQDWAYWGKPLPGFGDPNARVLLVGLAPAAHGANRTGRMFTGDRSGDWLFGALHRAGFANRAQSRDRADGLRLRDVYITAAVRCAPPGNKPTATELHRCQQYLLNEMSLLARVSVVVALGKIAADAYWAARAAAGLPIAKPRPRFGHGVCTELGDVTLITSYHPSQQNTFTGRLTQPMFDRIFEMARRQLGGVRRRRGPVAIAR